MAQGLPRGFAKFDEYLSVMPRILNDQITPGYIDLFNDKVFTFAHNASKTPKGASLEPNVQFSSYLIRI